jgi:hypothetical protein
MTPHDQVTQFLLRELPEAEHQTIQERIFFDDDFAEAVETAERELLDTYARGDLSPELRRRVETRLLFNADQRLKLEVAKALVGKRPRKFGYRFVALAATLLLLASTAAYIGFQLRHQVQPAVPTKTVQITSPQPVVAFLLTPGALRGAHPTTIQIPSGATVRFDLELSGNYDLKQLSASLYDSSDKRIWNGGNFIAAAGGLSIELPGSLFHAGSFRLVLDAQPPATYYFVLR